VLIPSYRHPMAQASAIATIEQDRAGTPDGRVRHRLYGAGRGMGKKPLSLASMRTQFGAG